MKRLNRLTMGVAMMAAILLCTTAAVAQDPAKVAPKIYKVLLNNSRVRVLEVNAKTGEKTVMHAHPDYIVYSLVDGKARFTDPKGASAESDMKAGEVTWREAERHSTEAVTDIHVLLFELKGRRRATTGAGAADAIAADPGHFKVLFDNERIRVLEFRQAPGEKSAMHSHPDYVTYNFTDGKSKFSYPKAKSVERASKAGDVVWHRAETHAGENISGAEIHVLLVELK